MATRSPRTIIPDTTKDATVTPTSAQRSNLVQQPTGERSQAPILHDLIQTKLTIGAAGDRYEQEADRVAQAAVSQIHTAHRCNLPLI
ncbi:MAG: hypothetical protein VKJ24_11205, partial [Synechococcales bacterium]|nr:hypothetical protein [Synechococcales bacterium]